MKIFKVWLAITLAVVLITGCITGCGAVHKPLKHPGAINDFDSYAYDTLITIQGALEKAKETYGANAKAKPLLNQAIAAYDSAEASYKVYHTLGTGDPALQFQVQKFIDEAIAGLGDLQKQFGGK